MKIRAYDICDVLREPVKGVQTDVMLMLVTSESDDGLCRVVVRPFVWRGPVVITTMTQESVAAIGFPRDDLSPQIACQLMNTYMVNQGAQNEAWEALVEYAESVGVEELTIPRLEGNPRPARAAEPAAAPAEPKPAPKSKPSGEYKSAAAMFSALLLEGGHTDKEIYEAVRDVFGDKSKPSYVQFYRRKLQKEGKL